MMHHIQFLELSYFQRISENHNHKNVYQNYSANFNSLRMFAAEYGRMNEVRIIDYFFTKRLPTLMLMAARSDLSLKGKIDHVRKVLSDPTICAVLNEDWQDFSVSLSKKDIKLYRSAKEKKAFMCLLFGYKLKIRMELSAIISRLRC